MTVVPMGVDRGTAYPAGLLRVGHRYESIDGTLRITPPGGVMHQRVAGRLRELLHAAGRESGLETLDGLAVDCGHDTLLEPDGLLVAAAVVDAAAQVIPAADVALVAEVASVHSTRVDGTLKAAVYADAGIAHYLLVEPDVPRVTWFARAACGRYERRAVAVGGDVLRLTEPVGVDVVPQRLLRAWD